MMRMLLVACLACVMGCAAPGRRGGESPARDPRAVPVYAGAELEPVAWEAMVEEAAEADVVVIGEIHGQELGLAAAAALWEEVLARRGDGAALSMEFFERDEQGHLDDYLVGVTDEAAFREATGRTESNYPPGHRALVERAREAGARVYAANAPRRYSTLARTEGFDVLRALRESQRRLFEVPERLPEGEYRERFFEVFAGMMASHGGGEMDEAARRAQIEGFFRAQSVWDATMAETIARALSDGHRPVVQVVGRFHADHEGGLVQALRARRPGARIVTVSMQDASLPSAEDEGRADFILMVGGRNAEG